MALYVGPWEPVPAHKSHQACLCLRERGGRSEVRAFIFDECRQREELCGMCQKTGATKRP